MRSLRTFILLLPLLAASCAPPGDKPTLASDDPGLKIPAIKHAAAAHDQSSIPELVKALRSDDAAIRFYAGRALIKLTGKDLGFRYYDDELSRNAAIQRWERWLNLPPTSQPATQPASSQPATRPE